jgi:hypothetical protein
MALPEEVCGDLIVHCVVDEYRTVEPFSCFEIAAMLPKCKTVQVILIARSASQPSGLYRKWK